MAPWLARSILSGLLASLALIQPSVAQTTAVGRYVTTVDTNGNTVYLADNRKPALYTQDFGDCLGHSDINVTRFDAAYYKDNMTILFHLAGNTGLRNESLMMYIGVYAYGESRFELTFNPCNANIASMCPMNSSVPIEADGIIPIAQSDVASIPSIALGIPDFEGEAILRIFANSTETEIGCYSAVITNGATFSQPDSVGTILGIFTIVALIASFATAIYGDNISVMRNHYAHSLSILVVFAVFQHIFFTGALSMNWPSVLVAFWSNFAWTGGMIYSSGMQNSINKLVGSNFGNTTQVGAASTGAINEGLGGGYNIHQIYRRAVPGMFKRDILSPMAQTVEQHLYKRTLTNSSQGYSWYGQPVKPGLPLPGNYSGFAGTLGQERIPASNAFMTGFLWFLILLVLVVAAVIGFKWLLEAFSAIKLVKKNRLAYFRSHWLGYTALATLRTLFIGFFMMMFLTMFQFTYHGSAGVVAIAAIVFLILFVGMLGLAGYACFYRVHFGNYVSKPDRINFEQRRVMKVIPWYSFSRASSKEAAEDKVFAGSFPFWQVSPVDEEAAKPVTEDEDYIKKFGWLAARFRRTRWWFFAVWLVYEFIRACFYAGASGHPITQVFGLLVVEIVAFVAIIVMRPFEGQRLNAIVVYLLGFSKVATVALSAAFDVRFNLPRILTTVLGIVIIVIQGVLTIVLLIAIVAGAVTSWMSVMRNRSREEFRPKKWANLRDRYFKHLNQAATDLPPPPPPVVVPEEPKDPYFSVNSVRRMAKIEDEDRDDDEETPFDEKPERGLEDDSTTPAGAAYQSTSATQARRSRVGSRAGSVRSMTSYSTLPFGARPHRPSWSSRDYSDWQDKERMSSQVSLGRFPEDQSARGPIGRGAAKSSEDLRLPSAFSSVENLGKSSSPLPRPKSIGHVSSSRVGTPTVPSLPSATSRQHGLETPTRQSRVPLTPALELTEDEARSSAAP